MEDILTYKQALFFLSNIPFYRSYLKKLTGKQEIFVVIFLWCPKKDLFVPFYRCLCRYLRSMDPIAEMGK